MNAFRVAESTPQPFRQRIGAWVPVLGLAALVIVLALCGDTVRLLLRYERGALEAGELWRLVTAHLVHLGSAHAAMNVAALIIIRALLADAFSAGEWLAASGVSALGIGAGLYWFSPSIEWYVGLSGVLHGLLAAGGLVLLRESTAAGGLLLAALLVKLLLEQAGGALPLTESAAGGPVVVAAHLYGAASGACYGVLRAASRREPPRL